MLCGGVPGCGRDSCQSDCGFIVDRESMRSKGLWIGRCDDLRQVSKKHLYPMMKNKKIGIRERLGAFNSLFIREIYPWCASQIITLLIYWTIRGEKLNFRVPLLLATACFTTAVGPITALFTYNLCRPTLRKPWWFVQYSIFSLLVYTDAKNVVARVSLLKEINGRNSVARHSTIGDCPRRGVGAACRACQVGY